MHNKRRSDRFYRALLLFLWLSQILQCKVLGKEWFLLKKSLQIFQEILLQRSLEQAQPNHGIIFECRSQSNHYVGAESHFTIQLGDLRGYQLLDPNKSLALFLHGWKGGGTKAWVQDLLRTWTHFAPNCNVCVVDWSNLSQNDYKTSSRSIFDVGLTVAAIIETLEVIQPNFRRDQVTIAGFSLGAHAAGFAGQRLGGKLQQIIALDPAGPLFTMPTIVSPRYRLDKYDARYVQVLHTSAGTLGTNVKCGHADFYANGGTPVQPNCRKLFIAWQDKLRTYTEKITCSHSTAATFFKQSMDPFYPFIGHHCDNYRNFTAGQCEQNHRGRFGIHSQRRSRGNFYFDTYSTPPFVPPITPHFGALPFD